MLDVTTLGELLIDFTTDGKNELGYPILSAHPGGGVANFLAAVVKLGGRGAFYTKVGDDAFGRLLKETMEAAGIDSSGILTDPDAFTTLAFVTLDNQGDREFSFSRKPGADTRLCFEEMDLSLIDRAKAFHIGTLSLTGEPVRTATKKAVAYAREKGKLITLDPNLRLPLWSSPAEAKEQMLWALNQADIVKISEEEIQFLFGLDGEAGAEKLLREFGVKLAFVTLGKAGCLFANERAQGRVPNFDEVKTVDTTGAGDIFGGTAVYQILRSGIRPEDLNGAALTKIAAFACGAASLSTEKYGGISSIPAPEEVTARTGLRPFGMEI